MESGANEGSSVGKPRPLGGIEQRSIDYVPPNERHGKTWHQAPFWFTGNFNFFTLAMGFIGPTLGLGFRDTCIASVSGILFGTFFMAFHASQGPDLGLPQMIQSRAQFGYRGVIVPLFATLFTFVGFNVLDTVLVGQGLNRLLHINPEYTAAGLAVIAVILAIFGHDVLHRAFRILFWLGLPLYVWLSVSILNGSFGTVSPSPPAFSWAAFWTQFAAGASYNITFAPYVSDYTRYLPRGKSKLGLLISVYLGASLSAIWLVILGAWLATFLGASDGMASLNAAGDRLFPYGGWILVLIAVAALAAAMGLNAYSGMLTVLTGVDSFVRVKPSRTARVVCILLLACLWLYIVSTVDENAIGTLSSGLTMMLYLLIPWTAINLLDYFVIRKGRYAIKDFFKRDGIYGRWAWRGLISYVIGFLASTPFFYLPGIYEGPVAKALDDIDVAWLPGLIVSAVVYYLFMRPVDLTAEFVAARESQSTPNAIVGH